MARSTIFWSITLQLDAPDDKQLSKLMDFVFDWCDARDIGVGGAFAEGGRSGTFDFSLYRTTTGKDICRQNAWQLVSAIRKRAAIRRVKVSGTKSAGRYWEIQDI